MMLREEQVQIAGELKDAFNTIAPFIEKHTSIVCPSCEKVCCIDKHGYYDEDDLLFLNALVVDVPHNPYDRKETDPCRFLAESGCLRERWMRPYRCTFFFCDVLLKSLENDNAKLYRAFVDYLQYLVSVRQNLLGQR